MAGGLDLSAGGTNLWELAALKDDATGTAGTDFDQIALTGGALNLGGSSTLSIRFIGRRPRRTAATRSGKPRTTGPSSRPVAPLPPSRRSKTPVYPAGTFTTSAQAGGIVLTFTPLTPVTSFSIATGPGSYLTLSYSGGSGSQFVLLQTNNVAAPLSLWTRVQTNTSSPGTFTITPGADPQEFYQIKSE